MHVALDKRVSGIFFYPQKSYVVDMHWICFTEMLLLEKLEIYCQPFFVREKIPYPELKEIILGFPGPSCLKHR